MRRSETRRNAAFMRQEGASEQICRATPSCRRRIASSVKHPNPSTSAKRMNVNSRGCQPTERAMQRLFDPEGVEQFGQSEIIAQCLARLSPIGHHALLCNGLNACT